MSERTHHCGEVTLQDVGKQVQLKGWVQKKRRDFGDLIFIDLRDRTGIVQIVFTPESSKEALQLADAVRNEYVLDVKGLVVERDPETINPNIATGKIEVKVIELNVLNSAKKHHRLRFLIK
ncbi:hypothetical protein GCM10020331_035840 [Ectobacillus funiculus]